MYLYSVSNGLLHINNTILYIGSHLSTCPTIELQSLTAFCNQYHQPSTCPSALGSLPPQSTPLSASLLIICPLPKWVCLKPPRPDLIAWPRLLSSLATSSLKPSSNKTLQHFIAAHYAAVAFTRLTNPWEAKTLSHASPSLASSRRGDLGALVDCRTLIKSEQQQEVWEKCISKVAFARALRALSYKCRPKAGVNSSHAPTWSIKSCLRLHAKI